MERDDLIMLLGEMGAALLAGEMAPALFARTVDGLIGSNLDTVPDLESVHLRLIDFGVRGAENPPDQDELRAIASRLVEAARSEGAS